MSYTISSITDLDTHQHLYAKPSGLSLSFLRACCYIQFYYKPYALI